MNDYGSENSSDVIASQNCSSYNFTRASGDHSTVLTIFAMLEFAIFILKLLLGCVVIYCLYRSKMLRDTVSALMTSVAASFMILLIPLNLLVGLSVLIDQPSIGSCNIRILLIAVFIITVSQEYLIPFSIGLIATVQFLIIKYGLKRVSTRNVLSAFALLMSFAMGLSIVHCSWAVECDHHSDHWIAFCTYKHRIPCSNCSTIGTRCSHGYHSGHIVHDVSHCKKWHRRNRQRQQSH